MATGTATGKKISPATQQHIKRVEALFDEDTVNLGRNLINEFTRATITQALAGDKAAIARLGWKAMGRGWVKNVGGPKLEEKKPDMPPILRAIEWMRVMRSITSN